MNKELLAQAKLLWDKEAKISKFRTRYKAYPFQEAARVQHDMQSLTEQIPENPSPQSQDELHQGELKRRLTSKAFVLETFLSGRPFSLEDIVNVYGLEPADLDDIFPWLEQNRAKTLDAIDRLFANSTVASYELELPIDIPHIRQQAEGYAASQITNYHQKLGSMFEQITAVGNYLHRITSQPTTKDRSYFSPLTRRLSLSMNAICYEAEDGTIQLRERELIQLFGHEGMGHALQAVITESSNLPFFIKDRGHETEGVEESVTQHYERIIFEDLKKSKKTQKDLRITDTFGEIYQDYLDTLQIDEYSRKFFNYSILVLANKSHGDPHDPEVIQKKIGLLSKVSLTPSQARNQVEQNRYNYDTQGNLDSTLTSELRYASQAVSWSLDAFAQHGISYDNKNHRSHIDMTFLTGYFTPVGFVQKAELAAMSK